MARGGGGSWPTYGQKRYASSAVPAERDSSSGLLRGHPGALRIKVCCIASDTEADLAIAAGADALGLVSAMPSGPGPIPEAAIESIVRYIDARAATVLLTAHQD